MTVSNLGADITPANGVAGICFASQGGRGSDGEMLPVHGTNADGGGGGSLLNLTVTTPTRSIITHGDSAYGVKLSSIGGDGGTGGVGFLLVIPIPLPPFVIITPGFGGKGGGGGGGGQIDATIRTKEIHTYGAGAAGVLATSQAGNGGEGGYAVGIYGGGGDGGVGGAGGPVTLTVEGSIVTEGAAAPGIAAQSTGGYGGNGGAGDGIVGNGGSTLGSGPGGAVTVTNLAAITTGGAESNGIFAESVGGMAGSGGRGGGLVSFGAGGNSAGAGGNVAVTNYGAITTTGSEAHAIMAQSTGGGGGTAGNSFGLVASMGGNGSAQGNGGTISVTNDSALTASGQDAIGIFAQSVGGGGGTGGKGAGLLSFGGDGSASGNGGNINVTNSGEIHSKSQAISAASFGGGGGSGGTSGTILVTVGGNAAGAGKGGDINVTNSGGLYTSQSDAAGIYAWSTGGGGGRGAGAESYGVFVAFAYGGKGGGGGDGGNVTVHHAAATVHTTGDRSHGIDAVSLGGGGGSGGDAITFEGAVVESMSDAIGGVGGSGGNGKTVKVGETNAGISGTIVTEGDHAHGIRAASVGGGGGAGGESMAFSFATQVPGVPFAVSATLSLGGAGGSGGIGGDASVVNAAKIDTSGFRAHGIFAESVGGGGGEGGQSISATALARVTADVQMSIGGSGGDGGNGQAAKVTNAGRLQTQGSFANGILAQSIGGGGGAGGAAVGLHMAILGGPLPGIDGTGILIVGGTGGDGGTGGLAQVTNRAEIVTASAFANGILAQSVGGGGGYGGLELKSDARLGITGPGVHMTLGASASGVSGDGGSVVVDHAGTIHTQGDFANAIQAQSVGGGGGYAASNIQDGDTEVGVEHATILGGRLGRGSGGKVDVISGGTLITDGAHAFGILAQSVGGGGGYAAVRVADNLNKTALQTDQFLLLFGLDANSMVEVGSAGGDGSAGKVSVSHTGAVTTTGSGAHGIVAISAGGTGAGDTVTVTVNGNVAATGADADGVYARSAGASGGSDIGVTLTAGSIKGGAGTGAGVMFSAGRNNLLTNSGTISAASGMAVLGDSGNETIENHGQVTGNIDLGAGANRFDNLAGARFVPGTSVKLGTGGTLSNAGTLAPGGDNHVVATAMNGSFSQGSSGVYSIDLDGRILTADRIDATGSTSLSGTAAVNLFRRGLVRPGTYRIDILTADAGVSGQFATAILPASTPLLNYSLVYLPDAVQLQAQAAGFRTVAGNRLGDAVARHLDAIASTVGGDLAEAMGEMQIMGLDSDRSRALTSLSPEAYGGMTQAGLSMSGARMSQLLGHLDAASQGYFERTPVGGFSALQLAYAGPGKLFATGGGYARDKNNALWLDVLGRHGDRNPDPGYTGYQYGYSGLAFGLDHDMGDGLMMGVALGYGSADLDYDAATGNGTVRDRQISVYGSYPVGSGYIDMVLSYARHRYDLTRNLVIGGINARATSQHNGTVLGTAITARAQYPLASWQIEPFAGMRYTAVDEDGFTESGAGGLGLIVQRQRTESLSAEIGARIRKVLKRDGGDVIPSLSLSLDHDFRIDSQSVAAAYLDAPGNSFVIPGAPAGADGLKLALGVAYVPSKGVSSVLRVEAEQRSGYRSYGLFGGLRYEF